jgi:hypothetical protein
MYQQYLFGIDFRSSTALRNHEAQILYEYQKNAKTLFFK